MTTAVLFGWLSIFGVLTLWELRRMSAQIDELRRQAHTHPRLRWDHEPAVGRLLAGERDASARRMGGP